MIINATQHTDDGKEQWHTIEHVSRTVYAEKVMHLVTSQRIHCCCVFFHDVKAIQRETRLSVKLLKTFEFCYQYLIFHRDEDDDDDYDDEVVDDVSRPPSPLPRIP